MLIIIPITQLFLVCLIWLIIGYANLGDVVVYNITSQFTCGNTTKSLLIDSVLPGQNNFVTKIQCEGPIDWVIQGTQLHVSQVKLAKLSCGLTAQKIVYPLSVLANDTAIENIRIKIAQRTKVPIERIILSQLTNPATKRSAESYELLVSVTPEDDSDPSPAESIYSYSTDPKSLDDFGDLSSTISANAGVTLTFNETVGKTIPIPDDTQVTIPIPDVSKTGATDVTKTGTSEITIPTPNATVTHVSKSEDTKKTEKLGSTAIVVIVVGVILSLIIITSVVLMLTRYGGFFF